MLWKTTKLLPHFRRKLKIIRAGHKGCTLHSCSLNQPHSPIFVGISPENRAFINPPRVALKYTHQPQTRPTAWELQGNCIYSSGFLHISYLKSPPFFFSRSLPCLNPQLPIISAASLDSKHPSPYFPSILIQYDTGAKIRTEASGGTRVFFKGRSFKWQKGRETSDSRENQQHLPWEHGVYPLQQKNPSLSHFLVRAVKYPLMVHCRKLEHTEIGISSIIWSSHPHQDFLQNHFKLKTLSG